MILWYLAGREHVNADALSRISNQGQCLAFTAAVRLGDLPCGGCKYCVKAQESWGSFLEEVDDAVPSVTRMAHPVVSIVGHSGEEGTAMENHRGIGTTVNGEQDRKEVNRLGEDGKTDFITVEDQSVLSDVEASIAEVLIFSTIEEPRSDQDLSAQCISTGYSQWKPGEIASEEDVTLLLVALEQIPWNTSGYSEGEAVVHVNITRQQAKKAQQTEDSPNCATLSSEKLCTWEFSNKDLEEAQGKDHLLVVFDWLRNSTKPNVSTLFRASPAAKFYRLIKERFILMGGVLYQNDANTGDKRLVLPKSLQEEAMRLNHDLLSSGHQGIIRTKEWMKEKFA